MNVIEAEGIHDLICSQTHSQRRRALSAMSGTVENVYESWRTQVIQLMAHLEVNIDFGEEELIERSVLDSVRTQLNELLHKIETHLYHSKHKSDLIKDGLKVTIIGESNAGKEYSY